jgi:integrase
MRAPTDTTVREAGAAWLAGAHEGSIRNRSGDRYKPSTIRGYAAALEAVIYPALGPHKLSAITRPAVQELADGLLADGKDASTIRNALMPLRVIFRRALARGGVALNPCTGIELPAVRGRASRGRLARGRPRTLGDRDVRGPPGR